MNVQSNFVFELGARIASIQAEIDALDARKLEAHATLAKLTTALEILQEFNGSVPAPRRQGTLGERIEQVLLANGPCGANEIFQRLQAMDGRTRRTVVSTTLTRMKTAGSIANVGRRWDLTPARRLALGGSQAEAFSAPASSSMTAGL